MRNKLTVTIITSNEESNIERCLKSLSWVDEIVVIDSYSEDKTVDICKKYNCRVIQVPWQGFGITKKNAVDAASNDWILSIDADEELSESLKQKIENILVSPMHQGYLLKRKSFYMGKEIKHCGWGNDYPLRMFNRKSGNFNNKEVHESVVIEGEKIKIHEPLFHYTYPSINTHIAKMNRYSDLLAEDLVKKGKHYSIFSSVFFGAVKFINMYFLKLGILDGKIGFILCFNSAIGVYLKYVKSWSKKK